MTRQPTLDDAIEAIAAVEGQDPDELLVEDVLIDRFNRRYEAQAIKFRYSPRVIEQARLLLHQYTLNRELDRIFSERMAATQIPSAA